MVRVWAGLLWRVFLFPLLLAWLGMTVGGSLPSRWTLFNLLAWLVVIFSSIAVHELGHALAARLLGLRVRRVVIGQGREVLRFRIGSTEIRLHQLPFLGLTFIEPAPVRALRSRMALAVLAGPVASAVLLTFALADDQWWPACNMNKCSWISSFVAIMNLGAVLSLVPAEREGFRTDGALLLSLFSPEFDWAEFAIGGLILDAFEAAERHDDVALEHLSNEVRSRAPNSKSLKWMAIQLALTRAEHSRARELVVDAINSELDRRVLRVLKNDLAWVDFLLRDDSLKDEANTLSLEAVSEAKSASVNLLHTRGAVLFWLGRLDEGFELLSNLLPKASGSTRAATLCVLALISAKRGALVQARRMYDEAVALDPKHVLIDETRAATSPALAPEPPAN